jgi:hypothetical protein
MSEEDLSELKALLDEISEMPDDSSLDIYNIHSRIVSLAKSEIKSLAKGYSRQRIVDQLNELADILDARISMQMIEDGEWNPELDKNRPDLNGDVDPDPDVKPDDKPGNEGSDIIEEPEEDVEIGWLERIFTIIRDFFLNLFNTIFGKNN